MLKTIFALAIFGFILHQSCTAQTELYLDSSKPINIRVEDLLHRLTLEQKIGQMAYNSPAIPDLKIPAYNWWSEALHGVARSGVATVFPQAIALGATFDEDLLFRVSSVISDEA